ncbi:hypothetical protein ECC02_011772 [Trypanosoma cruzi]|uniref:Uncharacterized protein n=1 Tax=Trypanosoma cruzi TaxID=5693 RepID=A0A7J6XNW7_TRYCR|nr:hypothetical protein ECC02_011772 [Trypanosoma cruzi]
MSMAKPRWKLLDTICSTLPPSTTTSFNIHAPLSYSLLGALHELFFTENTEPPLTRRSDARAYITCVRDLTAQLSMQKTLDRFTPRSRSTRIAAHKPPPHTSVDRVMKNRVDRSRKPSRTSAGPYRDFSWPRVVCTYCDPPTVARSVEFASNTLEFGGIAPCSTIVPSSDVTFVMLTMAWGIRRAVLSLRPPTRSCAPPASTQWRSVTFSASANASIERRSTVTVIGPLNTTESKHAVARPPPTVTDSVSVTPPTQPCAPPPPPPALATGTSNGRHASPTPPARQPHAQSENEAVSASKHASAAAQPSHGTTLTEGRPAMR